MAFTYYLPDENNQKVAHTTKENAVIVGFKKYISNNFVSEEKYKIDELLEQMKL